MLCRNNSFVCRDSFVQMLWNNLSCRTADARGNSYYSRIAFICALRNYYNIYNIMPWKQSDVGVYYMPTSGIRLIASNCRGWPTAGLYYNIKTAIYVYIILLLL